MSQKSVLITTYHQAFLQKGGGEYELLEVAFNLRKLGLIADIYGPFSCDLDVYDTIIHFSLNADSLPLLEKLHEAGKRIILWPNFWQSTPFTSEQEVIFKSFFALAHAVVFKSETEQSIFTSLLPKECTLLRVPAGVDPCFAKPAPTRLFRASYNIEKFLLWVGIFEPQKNQLEVIKALKASKEPIVFVGNYRDKNYYNACVQAAPEHFVFLSPLKHKSDMLRAALQECHAYIEMSADPGGKSVLEAATAGAQLIIPHSAWAEEHFGSAPFYATIGDANSLVQSVNQALNTEKNSPCFSEATVRHHLPNALLPMVNYIKEA